MRRLLKGILVTAALVLVAPQVAAAADCKVPASGYQTGGAPGSGPANDPLFKKQWGLGQINAPGAWARGARGRGVTIAIVDSGVDLGHPDLRAKLLPGTDLVKKTANLSGPGCPGPQDENGHGTHVAGIAAAITNNGIGVAGTAPGARILPVRVLDKDGSGDDTAVDSGIRWAADHGAKVINLSLGSAPILGNLPGSSAATEKAVAYAFGKGAVVVASAGNESAPACDYPAAATNAVCVGATDEQGMPSFYSNFPVDPDGTVGVRAPGGFGDPVSCESSLDIWSTMWPKSDDDNCGGTIKGYDTLAGTSMSAPFVSGVAALLAGRGLTAPQILECLKTKSSNDGSYDPAFGYGIVDADKAVAGCSPKTPAFHPHGSKKHVTVTVRKTSRSKLVENGRVRVTVKTDTAVKVRLRAAVRRGKKSTRGAHRTVRLKQAGKRHVTLTLSQKARRALAKHRKARVRVTFSGGGESGVAKQAR
ncbi:MAG: serine protease [Thermoleophilaceae bacterium]|nr:serine protease [Thermoleophilaceae bacterium]